MRTAETSKLASAYRELRAPLRTFAEIVTGRKKIVKRLACNIALSITTLDQNNVLRIGEMPLITQCKATFRQSYRLCRRTHLIYAFPVPRDHL